MVRTTARRVRLATAAAVIGAATAGQSVSSAEQVRRPWPVEELCQLVTPRGSGTRYYVDSSGRHANDQSLGTSPEAPLRSLAGLRGRHLRPGDSLAFRAGAQYEGAFTLTDSGEATSPILITSYGEGERPRLNASGPFAIRVAGASHVVIEGLEIQGAADTAIFLDEQTRNITVQNVLIRRSGRGMDVRGDGHLLVGNSIQDLHMVTNTPGGDDDSGAQGFVVGGQGHRFLCNHIRNARAASYDYGVDGVGFEFWRSASDIVVAGNWVEDSAGFLEIGGQAGDRVTGIVIRNNLALNSSPFHWLHNRRGTSNFGIEITALSIVSNTIVDTQTRGLLFGFSERPMPGTYRFSCNIVYAPKTRRLFNQAFDRQEYNLYFTGSSSGIPNSQTGDPRFVSLSSRDFRLQDDTRSPWTGAFPRTHDERCGS